MVWSFSQSRAFDRCQRGWFYDAIYGNGVAQALARAKQLFDVQRAFALRHGLRVDGLKPTKVGDEFAAFLAVEWGERISKYEFGKAWAEIEQALINLFGMSDLLDDLRRAEFLMAQRALQFKQGEVTIKAVPDLVAFYRGRPPLIVDWKVHFFGARDYWLQLATYALALARCSPHWVIDRGSHGSGVRS